MEFGKQNATDGGSGPSAGRQRDPHSSVFRLRSHLTADFIFSSESRWWRHSTSYGLRGKNGSNVAASPGLRQFESRVSPMR